MQTLVIAGGQVFPVDDVEIWVVTDEEFDGLVNEEISWKTVEPSKMLSASVFADNTLMD